MTSRGTTRSGAAWPAALAVVMLAFAGTSCKRVSSAKAGPEGIAPDQTASAEQVIEAYRSRLAVVETTWRQRSGSFMGGWIGQGAEGAGLVIAGDGRNALVLTSRHMVDPRYRRDPSTATRDVCFRVRVRTPDGGMSWKDARLVAVYIHDADLALLRIGAPCPEPFALPLAPPRSLRVGDEVVTVGPPAAGGLVHGTGVIESVWRDNQFAASAMQIRLTDGKPATAGVVFARRGGRLVGVLRGQKQAPPGRIGDLYAVSADALPRSDYWSCLLDAGTTRRLLGELR